MRVSELSAQTGVTVPTIKYYLRGGLLPEGERSSATQAAHGERHVERLRVIRALLDAGVSIAETRRVLGALDDPPASAHDLLGTAHAAITPLVDEALDLSGAERLVEGLGWKPGMCDDAVLNAVARALQGLERAGLTVPDAAMTECLASMRRIADCGLRIADCGLRMRRSRGCRRSLRRLRYGTWCWGRCWWSRCCSRCGGWRSR